MGFMSDLYTKPGPGVPKNEPKKKGAALFFTILGREFFELIKLNLLYIVFCIPIITIPAATTAMSKITLTMVRDINHFLWPEFLVAFKKEFIPSLLCGIIVFGGSTAALFAAFFYNANLSVGIFMLIPMALCLMIAIILYMAGYYLFPMLTYVDLPLKNCMKNAFLMTIVCFWQNLLTFIIVAALTALIVIFFPFTTIILLLFGFSFINFITTFCAYAGIRKYIVLQEPVEI